MLGAGGVVRLFPLRSSHVSSRAAAASAPCDGENHPQSLDGVTLGGSPAVPLASGLPATAFGVPSLPSALGTGQVCPSLLPSPQLPCWAVLGSYVCCAQLSSAMLSVGALELLLR